MLSRAIGQLTFSELAERGMYDQLIEAGGRYSALAARDAELSRVT